MKSLGEFAFGSHQAVKPATIEWIDVAGLAKGAHRGEGLGNRFLAKLRECHALCHLIRCFDDPDIIVHNNVGADGGCFQPAADPVSDADTINLELVLADLSQVERRLAKKTSCDDLERETLETIAATCLREGIPARNMIEEELLSDEAIASIKSMGLLTLKPMLYVFNVDEVDFALNRDQTFTHLEKDVMGRIACSGDHDLFAFVSAKVESEIEQIANEDERIEFLQGIGLLDVEKNDNASTRIQNLMSSYVLPTKIMDLLDLSLVYTGPGVPPERSQTTKAHLLLSSSKPKSNKNSMPTTPYDLAGRIHQDIQNGFIRAEICSAEDLLQFDSYFAAKEAGGCIRTEGRDYILQPNDVVLIKWR